VHVKERAKIVDVETDIQLPVVFDQSPVGLILFHTQVPRQVVLVQIPMGQIEHAGHDVGRLPVINGEDAFSMSHE
jgi:hypothetical protein